MLVTAAATAATSVSVAAAEPPPLVDFFRRAAFVNMVMAPNGQAIATLTAGPSGRVGLAVIDLRDLARTRNIATFGDADVLDVRWVNDERLVFNVTNRRLP